MTGGETFLDGRVTMLVGDVRAMLKTLPADHFDCVVTSPPYWGLRDYGVDGQIGLERTLGEHLEVMVDVFNEVRRVMKPTATLWLNYGDCYATSPNGRSAADTKAAGNDDRTFRDKPFSTVGAIYAPDHEKGDRRGGDCKQRTHDVGEAQHTGRILAGGMLKPKDLCMIPNRLAIALQEAGWWVRSEIIWGKTNPMPDSSGRYRPSTAHEKIFMLVKSAKYFYDSEAVAVRRKTVSDTKKPDGWNTSPGAHGSFHPAGREKGEKIDKQRGHSRRHDGFNDRWEMERAEQVANGRLLRNYEPADLNVWPISPQPFPESHFATFPPELATRCITAGCPEGGTVLDPFGGAGTTALVAAQLGCPATLIELNPDYATLARARIEAAFMGKEEGSRHMVKRLGKDKAPFEAGSLFAGIEAAE